MPTLYIQGGSFEGCVYKFDEWVEATHTQILEALRGRFGPAADVQGSPRRMWNCTLLLSYTVSGLEGDENSLVEAAKDCLKGMSISVGSGTDFDPGKPPNYPYLLVSTHPQKKPAFKTIWIKERAPSPPPRRNSC